MGGAASPNPAWTMGLSSAGSETPEIDSLVGRAAVEAEVQVLVVSIFHRVHNFLRHPHSESQVAAHLPDHDGGTDVACLDLNVLARNFLHHAQGVGTVALTAVLGAIGECSRQLVCLCVIHLLIHTFLEVLEDDSQLNMRRNPKLYLLLTEWKGWVYMFLSSFWE